MTKSRSITVLPGPDGWVYVEYPPYTGRIYVRVEPVEDGADDWLVTPLVIMDIFLDGDGAPLAAQTLRDIPLQAIETLLNEPNVRFQIRDNQWAAGGPPLRPDIDLSHAFKAPKKGAKAGTKTRRPKPAHLEESPRPALSRPTTTRLTEPFLNEVAAFYLDALSRGERPLVAIEHHANVPRNTAARWVAKTRAAGFLPKDPHLNRRPSGQ